MRFNKAELMALASHPSHKFDKEGVLIFRERQDSFFKRCEVTCERWCRLRGNLLFYFKTEDQWSDVIGVIILEDCQVSLDNNTDVPFAFNIVFTNGVQQCAAFSLSQRDSWVAAIHRSSISYMKTQVEALQREVDLVTESQPKDLHSFRLSTGLTVDVSKPPFLEMSVSCDNLRCDGDGQPPSPRAVIEVLSVPHKTWVPYFQTEVLERTSNPNFLITASFLATDGIDSYTKIKIRVYDVKEKLSDTTTELGEIMACLGDLKSAGRTRLTLNSPSGKSAGFVTLTTWILEQETVKTTAGSNGYTTPKHQTACPPVACHRRTQSLPPKLMSKLKHPSHGHFSLLYENPSISSFRFHSGLGGDISVLEIMAESRYVCSFPQQLLHIWIAEERKHQEELSSLGDLIDSWHSLQMLLLNQHVTLISAYSMAIDTLEEYVQSGCTLKRSIDKNESLIEYVPVNLHLQRLWAQNDTLRKCGFYDITTVGAFSANSHGFKNGGLACLLEQEYTSKRIPGSYDKAKLSDAAVEAIRKLRLEIASLLRALIFGIKEEDTKSLEKLIVQIKEKVKLLMNIIEPSLVEEAFEFLDQIRVPQNPSRMLTFASRDYSSYNVGAYVSPESALDLELKSPEGTKTITDYAETHFPLASSDNFLPLESDLIDLDLNNCYRPTDEPEPWDLIQLNVQASLMCLTSKIKNFVAFVNAKKDNIDSGDDYTQTAHAIDNSKKYSENKEGFLDSQNVSCSATPDVSPCEEDSGIVIDRVESEQIVSEDCLSADEEKKEELPFDCIDVIEREDRPSKLTVIMEQSNEDLNSSVSISCYDSNEAFNNHITTTSNNHLQGKTENNANSVINCDIVTENCVSALNNCKNTTKENHFQQCSGTDWIAEVRPSIRKLRQAMDGYVRTARLVHSAFRLQQSPDMANQTHSTKFRRDVCFSQALTTLVISLMTKLWCQKPDPLFLTVLINLGPLAEFEALLSCIGDDAGRIEDMQVAIEDLQTVLFILVPTSNNISVGGGADGFPVPCVSGNRSGLRVVLPVPKCVFDLLPNNKSVFPSDSPSFHVTPVFFNVGINEEATMASKLGKDSLQYKNNQDGYGRLSQYYHRFKKLLLPPGMVRSLRFTSCKSAKDRTGMAVTLEEVHILQRDYDLSEVEFKKALDCLRSEGTRIANCEKNIGIRKYAFSSLQLKMFPKDYRPPHGTYGASTT